MYDIKVISLLMEADVIIVILGKQQKLWKLLWASVANPNSGVENRAISFVKSIPLAEIFNFVLL